MDINKFKPWLYLTTKTNISKKKLYGLYNHFKTGKAIVSATYDELRSLDFIKPEHIQEILSYNEGCIEELISDIYDNEISLISIECDIYPELFKTLTDPPILLYAKGNIMDLNKFLCIASIGTRLPTEYGRRHTYKIVQSLAREGVIIVSGMAQGIDSVSHKAALDINAPTVAFVGTGVDVIYPAMNKNLYKAILKNGMVISEYVPKTKARPYHFPERNRLVSAVSQGLFLSEATIKSGSAITCRLSQDLNRDIFVLPGSIDNPASQLPISLLKDGGIPVCKGDDILNVYKDEFADNLSYSKNLFLNAKPSEPSTETKEKTADAGEAKILKLLEGKRLYIDDISALSGISLGELSVILLMLEMDGKIKNDNGNYYLSN